MNELRKEVIDLVKEHKGELVLDGFSVVKLEGFSEDAEDCYYCVVNSEAERYQISCLLGVVILKNKIAEDDYLSLEKLFDLNVQPVLNMIEDNT